MHDSLLDDLERLFQSLQNSGRKHDSVIVGKAIERIMTLEASRVPLDPFTAFVPAKWSDWIEWTGEYDDPVFAEFCGPDAILEVKFRDGTTLQDKPSGFYFGYDSNNPKTDIVAFRELLTAF